MTRFSVQFYSYYIATFLLFGFQIVLGQNLLLNPSFEDYANCPQSFSTFQEDVLFWTNPTIGSTDYFNSCSAKMKLKRNFMGSQEAFEGNAYAGIYSYGPKDYREYIQGELKVVLEKDRAYSVSAKISLAELSGYAVDELGFLFTSKELKLNIKNNIPHSLLVRKGTKRYVTAKQRNYFKAKEEWVEIKAEYIADGTERYISFGNFKDNKQTRRTMTGANMKKIAYYYVDMLVVEAISKPYKLDDVYVFKGLNFDTNDYVIKEKSKAQLQPLLKYLKQNTDLNIVIYGHTDNIGDEKYNKNLSKKRAKAVGLFLADNGLSPFRIAWQGYGNTKPTVANDSEEGREKNRRVEFIVSKKSREFYASGLFEDEN